MKPKTRRILQAVLYEVGAIAFVGPVLGFAFDKPAESTFALAWNYVFIALRRTPQGYLSRHHMLLLSPIFVNTLTLCEFPTSHPNDREQTRLAPYFGL